ncbi:SDR family oxidoreductase [Clostridioides mangenotii]|uniref:elongation factor P 5-aminopentanone reductase n=1 Tax=Metaclostridioides mangenotii TaxID=1540 RepID=UPI00214A608F|nr:SDR family oxidoreductase [Clostridioides mangenotii]MCR1953547.1 SDR family oxidoreductase [Clostridioides mangenotii]
MDKNKTVLITGSSRGIGSNMAEKFAREGYNVLINYNKSKENAEELYNKLKSEGLSVEAFKADVSKRDEVEAMFEYCLKEFGDLDILINNAGVAKGMLFTDVTDEDWDNLMNVNLKGVYLCTQTALKHMISEKKGKIINISSIWGIAGGSFEVHYSASKAGIIGLTKALAKEVGPSNIQVNCIAPGAIVTDMLEQVNSDDLELFRQETPLMKLGKPEDISNCALFLASDKADFFTGQVLSPNGGIVI